MFFLAANKSQAVRELNGIFTYHSGDVGIPAYLVMELVPYSFLNIDATTAK